VPAKEHELASEAKPTPLTLIVRPGFAMAGEKLMYGRTRNVAVPLSEPHVTVIV